MNNTRKNKLTQCISFGFAIGAMAGVIIGLISHNLALWLAIGVGTGLIIGSAIAIFFENKKPKNHN